MAPAVCWLLFLYKIRKNPLISVNFRFYILHFGYSNTYISQVKENGMFINEAFAASTVASTQISSAGGTFIQLALILLIFYLFLIRPQQKRMRAHFDLVNALKVGDKVVTSSGVYGKVSKLYEKDIDLEIAPNVIIKVERMAVGAVVNPEVKPTTKAESKPEKKAEKKPVKKAVKATKSKSAKK